MLRGAGDGRTSPPTATSRSSRPRRRWGRASRPATRSSRSTCSACRSSRSASCRATPTARNGFGSAGSRSLFIGGSAVQVASERTVEQARRTSPPRRSKRAPRDIEYRDGALHASPAPTARIGLFELARRSSRQRRIRARRRRAPSAAPTLAERLPHLRGRDRPRHRRRCEVVGYASVNDVGRVVNPIIVRGQLEGGAVQGIGQALCEQVVYDRDSGQLLTGSFMDYALPRADWLPRLQDRRSTVDRRA